ncbi:apolipoprotein N-acyltransferase [Corynebacterium pseudogenitalium]|uniref:apolipoprotein N-acyltransferase n=1 Tax=Corynebacterium pseudogenitalium TaxID=38303 RepID=UPI00210E7EC1|nr:apolipoprotein N-acyltransferase [Corynebacterium pseudogenitalium]
MNASLRLVLAVLSGVAVAFSYEPFGYWFLAVLGVGAFYLALMPWKRFATAAKPSPSAAFGCLLGFAHAATCYLILLPWIGAFVGAMPYVALAITLALSALITGAVGVRIARCQYGFLAFPFVYIAVEFLRSSLPFGGFSWVRLAWGQVNGPLVWLSSIGGPALVSLAACLAGVSLVTFLITRGRTRRVAALGFALPIGIGGLISPSFDGEGTEAQTAQGNSVLVAAIQGNVPRLGLDFNAQRRAVLQNHVDETVRAANDAQKQGEKLDLVIWPENSSDVNPFQDPLAASSIERAVSAVGAPVLVGTLTRDEVGARNTMVVFDPETGPGETHHKRFLQPFGEYMPMRDFFRKITDLVDLASDFKPGNGPGVVHMGGIPVGVATCYEVAEDPAYRMAINNGAQILATPTNNATFGFSDMTYQQLAMSRLRAIETDRAVVVAATSGVSAIVHPDGTVSQETSIFEANHLIERLPLHTTRTFAVRFGDYLEAAFVWLGFMLILGAAVRRPREYARQHLNNGEKRCWKRSSHRGEFDISDHPDVQRD